MSWKDISKSSYTLGVGKFAEWAPSHPFTIPYQGPKVVYSEGDEISSVADPVFNVEFTGAPLSGQHFPCGYWHKDYVPPFTIIYTSLLYPAEIYDSMQVGVSVLSGEFYVDFYFFLETYSFEDGISIDIGLPGGIFRSVIIPYSSADYIDIDTTLYSGVFKEVVNSYSIPQESLDMDIGINSGIFRCAVIDYIYWPHEDLDIDLTLIAGYHNA